MDQEKPSDNPIVKEHEEGKTYSFNDLIRHKSRDLDQINF
jgi:hypothetical protein